MAYKMIIVDSLGNEIKDIELHKKQWMNSIANNVRLQINEGSLIDPFGDNNKRGYMLLKAISSGIVTEGISFP